MKINGLNIKTLLLFAFTIVCISAKAQIIISTEVQGNGNVTVNWQDSEATTASGYILKWSYDANNLTNDTPLPQNTTSYTITDVNANARILYLLLIRQEGANEQEFFSSTIYTIVTPRQNASISQIDFNIIYKNPNGIYYIERLENSQWNRLDSIQNSNIQENVTYYDTITYPFCEPSQIDYRINFKFDLFESSTISNTDTIKSGFDQTPPKHAIDDYVSVIENGQEENIIIKWALPSENEINSIRINRKAPGEIGFNPIAIVSKSETEYVDKTASACDLVYEYFLVSVDKCQIAEAGTNSHFGERKNIILNIEENLSKNNITLNWNAYNSKPYNVAYYNIYKTASDGTSGIIEVEPNVFTYSDSKLISGNEYTYYVEAVLDYKDITSRSCKKTVTFNGVSSVQNCYINAATVVDDNSVLVSATYTPENTANKAILERATTLNGNYLEVGSINLTNGYISTDFEIVDNKVDVNYTSYFYRINISNEFMEQPVISENVGVNILLKCQADNTENNLSWNAYQHWDEGVREYKIIRIIDLQVDTISTQIVTQYSDNVTDNVNACYRVLAVSNPNSDGNTNVSLSNTSCAIKDSQFAVPNAFRPEGYNSEFKPKIFAFDSSKYSMFIYDKWGKLLFETNNYSKGWDGRHNGKVAPPDVYTFVIKFSDLNNKSIVKTGTFLLLR